MSYDKNALGARIRQARRGCGLTQEELARALGVEQSYISSLERGKKAGSHETLARIAQALSVSLDELTGIGLAVDLNSNGLPAGLGGLVRDQAIRQSMMITDEEIDALATLEPPHPISRDAYLQILIALRHGRIA